MLGRRLVLAAAARLCVVCDRRRRRTRSPSASAWRSPGGSRPNGKAALLAMQIWEAEINAKGGLSGGR